MDQPINQWTPSIAVCGIKFYTGGYTDLALTIDSSQNATFAGGIKVNGPGSYNTIKASNNLPPKQVIQQIQ